MQKTYQINDYKVWCEGLTYEEALKGIPLRIKPFIEKITLISEGSYESYDDKCYTKCYLNISLSKPVELVSRHYICDSLLPFKKQKLVDFYKLLMKKDVEKNWTIQFIIEKIEESNAQFTLKRFEKCLEKVK